jgi:hypothetical protein
MAAVQKKTDKQTKVRSTPNVIHWPMVTKKQAKCIGWQAHKKHTFNVGQAVISDVFSHRALHLLDGA